MLYNPVFSSTFFLFYKLMITQREKEKNVLTAPGSLERVETLFLDNQFEQIIMQSPCILMQ